MSFDLADLTPETMSPYVAQSFGVETSMGEVSLTLDNVKIFEKSDIRDNVLEIDGRELPARKAFALTFEGPIDPQLESDSYKVTHETLGTFALFLSPFRRDRDCMLYEAVFN